MTFCVVNQKRNVLSYWDSFILDYYRLLMFADVYIFVFFYCLMCDLEALLEMNCVFKYFISKINVSEYLTNFSISMYLPIFKYFWFYVFWTNNRKQFWNNNIGLSSRVVGT